MKLDAVMTRQVETVTPTETLREAARKMRDSDVGPLPVCADGHVVGMITDRDIAVRAIADGRDPNSTRVLEVMSHVVWSCHTNDEVKDAARVMAEKRVRRLVVLDRDDRLAGIVSVGDLATATRNSKLVGKVVESVSQPGAASRTLT